MNILPAPLQPTTSEEFTLSSGDRVAVPKATPRFARWTGDPPPSTYGGKAVVECLGRPAFAELAILWLLARDGWDGAWVTHRSGSVIYRENLMHHPPRPGMPTPVANALARIHAVHGKHGGTWDVCCHRAGTLLFVESKRRRRDQIRPDQVAWLEAGLSVDLPIESFLVVEWEFLEADGAGGSSTKIAAAHVPREGGPAGVRIESPLTQESRMSNNEKLERRTIKSALQRDHGWTVKSHVEGTLSVWPPSARMTPTDFRDEVVAAVRRLGYEPTVIASADAKGSTCIRFHTPGTLAQAGRGGHGFRPGSRN